MSIRSKLSVEEYRPGIEGRSRFHDHDPEDARFLLPGISFFREGRTPMPPTLAIEIRSPGESLSWSRERAAYHRHNGTGEVCLVHPGAEPIHLRNVAGDAESQAPGTITSAALAECDPSVAELFRGLNEEIA